MIAIICYALLHDISQTILVSSWQDAYFFDVYRRVHRQVSGLVSESTCYAFLTGHLVDLLWFLSACLFFSFWCREAKYVILIFLAVASEFSQLIFPYLGTFDVLDLVLYGMTLILFLFLDIQIYSHK